MNTPRKHGLVFYGVILSAVHFAAALLMNNLPLLMLRPEDMVGSGDVKPYWPPSHLRDAVAAAGHILSAPASSAYEAWPRMPDILAVPLFIFTSCLWGFALALVVRLFVDRFRASHEPRPV